MNAEGPLAALQTDEWITKDTTTRPVTHLDDQVWISRSVPRYNRLFTGFKQVLEQLHSALSSGSAVLIADP